MNAMKKPSFLPCLALISGTAAFGLRKCLYAFAVDQRGLLISGHPLSFALWAVVAAAAVFLLWQVRKPEGSNTYETAFAPSRLSAGACAVLAGSLLVTVLNHTPALGNVAAAWKVLGFLSAPAVMWAGICRSKGRKPFFVVHGLLCLFLLIHMVSRYQVWSSNPQLQDYIFELLAAVASLVSVPIIASGGAGKKEDFAELFKHKGMDAGLAASIFHTKQVEIADLKRYLRENGVEMRL